MARRLTSDEFAAVVKATSFSEQTQEIAYGVLVLGKKQVEFVTSLGLTKGAVNQAVTRVWNAALRQKDPIPPGFELVTAILPEAQAFQVKQWKKEADAKRLKMLGEQIEARRPRKGKPET